MVTVSELISSIPDCKMLPASNDEARICLKFMKLKPTIEVLKKEIPITYFLPNYDTIIHECSKSGIISDFDIYNIKIDNYDKFIRQLFKDKQITITDNQNQRTSYGAPDFKIEILDGQTFWFEVKSITDSIKQHQLQWMINCEEEVWYLFIESNKKYKEYINENCNCEKTSDKVWDC